MVTCDDYEERIGCYCDPAAPANPDNCEDVSHFQCSGQFDAWPDEWNIAEIAEGGCNCNATDPNQPPSFGSICEEGADTCEAPLACLAIDPPPSYGSPVPQPWVCTAACDSDMDCPSWLATGYCAGEVHLRCSNGSCQPRDCSP